MQKLNKDTVDQLFSSLKGVISQDAHKAMLSLDDIHPGQHQIEGLEWRYRLRGYAEGLRATDLIESSDYENIVSTLFGNHAKAEQRPGRDFKYSVDILAEKERRFTFDVPSMNPVDAYVQLTKRIAYKAVPGIISVLVYSGFEDERQPDSKPIRTFSHDELVFVSFD